MTMARPFLYLFSLVLFFAPATSAETEVQALYRVYNDGFTEVVSPSADIKHTMLEDQLTIGGGYSADAVTSASSDIRTFGSKDLDGETIFITDKRTEFSGNASWNADNGTFGIAYIQSGENDYNSKMVSLSASREFFQKNTTLSFSVTNGQDVISSSADELFSQPMEHQTYNLSLTQILNKISLIQFIADIRIENGFIASPYRRARLQQGDSIIGFPESHPGTRNRNALAFRYNYHLEKFKLSTSTVYRFYTDSWGVSSNTIEERLSRPVHKKWDLTLNLRYYMQKKAEFYEDVYDELGPFYTGNNTLGTFNSLLIGVRPTFKYSEKISIFGKYEKYTVTFKDHTDLGDPTTTDDDELLVISSINVGIGITVKY